MAKKAHTEHEEGRLRHFIERVDGKLFPVLGTPHVGPYDAERQATDALCPICHHDMAEHVIDHSTPNTRLECPVRYPPSEENYDPLDEVGMPTQRAKEKAARRAARA